MTRQEYATKVLAERMEDMMKGEYRLNPNDLRYEIEMAHMQGQADGMRIAREAMTKVYNNSVVISQRNGVTG